jgi:hypothetical protein
MTKRLLFRPVWVISLAFIVVGIGNLAALWFNLYRIATFSILFAIVIIQFSSSIRAVNGVGTWFILIKFAPIYIYVLMSTLWSPEPSDALVNAAYMVAGVIPAIIFGASLVRHYKGIDIANGLGILTLTFAIQALISILDGRNGMDVGDGTMRSLLGSLICLVSPIIVGAWLQTYRVKYFFFGLILLIMTITIGSRSALLIAPLASLLAIYIHNRKMAYRTICYSFPIILLVTYIIGPTIFSRFGADSFSYDISSSVIDDLNLSSEDRVDFDRRLVSFTALKSFFESPVIGTGYWSVYQINSFEYGRQLSAHGLIPGTLGELGLIGITIFSAIVMGVISRVYNLVKFDSSADSMSKYFLIGVVALIFQGMFHQIIEAPFFGMALAILTGLGYRRFKKI